MFLQVSGSWPQLVDLGSLLGSSVWLESPALPFLGGKPPGWTGILPHLPFMQPGDDLAASTLTPLHTVQTPKRHPGYQPGSHTSCLVAHGQLCPKSQAQTL